MHKTVLKLVNHYIDWNSSPNPLDNLPEDVLFTILHYLYSECLPSDLKEETARNCLSATADLPGFDSFRDLCELFLKNSALKQRKFLKNYHYFVKIRFLENSFLHQKCRKAIEKI